MKNEMRPFLEKQMDYLISDISILAALLDDEQLKKKPETLEETLSLSNKLCGLTQQFGYLSGKLEAYKTIYEQFIHEKK